MPTEKMYKLLTRGDVGILKGTEVDRVDGSVKYILDIVGEFGVMEQRKVAQSTFKRWWRLVEDTTIENQEVEVTETETEQQDEPKVQPTIEDLKKFNDAGGELTEEELQAFKKGVTKIESIEKVLEENDEPTEEDEPTKKPKPRKLEGVGLLVKEMVESKGGEFHLYSEGRGGVVKAKGKPVMFFGLRKHGAVRLFMKESLDDALDCPYPIVESNSYPKQYPFRIDIKSIDDESKDLLTNIFDLYI